jgi:hypothetical protein
MVAPEITTPLFQMLRDLDPEWILPGLQDMLPNSVGGVVANQTFVEAFLVGANHEMSRELLWRGFPTDQRGSVFRVFWDRRGLGASDYRDIAPIHRWEPSTGLGDHILGPPSSSDGSGDWFVLLVRGDLLARFPGASIFCVQAEWAFDADRKPYRKPLPIREETVALPRFGGRFEPDIAFYGFDQFNGEGAQGDPPPDSPATRASAGWFVVFQEHPMEACFGIAGEVGGLGSGHPLTTWRDLGTPLVVTAGQRTAGNPPRPVGYLDLPETTSSATFADAVRTLRPAWDGRSDSLAAILLASPFRLYLHASDLLGEPRR